MNSMSVPEPLEHSVVGVSLTVGDSSVDRVAVPNPIEHSGVSEPGRFVICYACSGTVRAFSS